MDFSRSPSPEHALLVVSDSALTTWEPIFQHSTQVVLYNPQNHALQVAVRPASTISAPEARPVLPHRLSRCPYCKRTLPSEDEEEHENDSDYAHVAAPTSRAANYFQLLEIANEISSRPASPSHSEDTPTTGLANGYFETFFKEEARLGMGASGTVYLCQHVLEGNALGRFAVKKIAVGDSHEYLVQVLREVRLLEQLRHPNIVSYQHAWIEPTRFSSFGPRVNTLHVLMQWAEAGSLDDFIAARLGYSRSASAGTPGAGDVDADAGSETPSARIRAFRAARAGAKAPGLRHGASWKAVHLLGSEEIESLSRDVVEGLYFLHDRSILHLDLKPGNILLTYDEGLLIPRAMLSDFGTSRDTLSAPATRTGNTGTLEFAAPETLRRAPGGALRPADSHVDMWSLGMVIHMLLFFALPYDAASQYARDRGAALTGPERLERLEHELLAYPGFKPTAALASAFDARHLTRAYLILLEGLLNVEPNARPSCERVLQAFKEGRFAPMSPVVDFVGSALVPVSRNGPTPVTERAPRMVEDENIPPARILVDNAVETVNPDVLDKPPRARTPAPQAPSRQRPTGLRRFLGLGTRQTPDPPALRVLKSCLLMAKMWSLQVVHVRHHPFTIIFLGVAALADSALDGWRMSLVLGSAHAVLLGSEWLSR